MAGDARRDVAEADGRADRGLGIERERRAGQRQVEDAAAKCFAIRERKIGERIVRHHAAVAAQFVAIIGIMVGKPIERGGEAVALSQGGGDRHGEAVLGRPNNGAFDASDVIDIGDDMLAGEAGDRGGERCAVGRNVDGPAGEFAPALQHVASGERQAMATVSPAIIVREERTMRRTRHAISRASAAAGNLGPPR